MLKGIDVSGYQADTIFQQMSPQFAVIKATEGVGYISDGFERLTAAWKKWEPNGLTGFYHYARPDTGNTAAEEATSFIDTIRPYEKDAIVALDWEGKSIGQPVKWAYQWLYTVANKLGKIPYIYMSASVVRDYNWKEVSSIARLWVASYSTEKPSIAYWPTWSMWQYTDTPCDQDYFPADREAWLNLANGRESSEAGKCWRLISQGENEIVLKYM